MKIVAVMEGEPRVKGLIRKDLEYDPISANAPLTPEAVLRIAERMLAANPPLTIKAMGKILGNLPGMTWLKLTPSWIYCGRHGASAGTASVLGPSMHVDFSSMDELTSYSNHEILRQEVWQGHVRVRQAIYPGHSPDEAQLEYRQELLIRALGIIESATPLTTASRSLSTRI